MKIFDIAMCVVGAFALKLWIADMTMYFIACAGLGLFLGWNRGSQN